MFIEILHLCCVLAHMYFSDVLGHLCFELNVLQGTNLCLFLKVVICSPCMCKGSTTAIHPEVKILYFSSTYSLHGKLYASQCWLGTCLFFVWNWMHCLPICQLYCLEDIPSTSYISETEKFQKLFFRRIPMLWRSESRGCQITWKNMKLVIF